MNIYSDNRTSKCTAPLSRSLELGLTKREVGLSKIHFPNMINTISDRNTITKKYNNRNELNFLSMRESNKLKRFEIQ